MIKKSTDFTPLFEALSDVNRLEILANVQKKSLMCKLNKKGECDQACINDLEKKLKISLPTVSYHVKILVLAGLLSYRKEGKFSYLEIKPKKFKQIVNFINSFIS